MTHETAGDHPLLSDAQLRARTENLLAEAVQVANQLRIQTERLAQAINHFQAEIEQVRPEAKETGHADD
jgi:hypothetical protein